MTIVYNVRVLQYEPTWSVLFYLRKCKINHSIENVSIPYCMGKQSPISIIDDHIYSCNDVITKLHSLQYKELSDKEIILINYIEFHVNYLINLVIDKNDIKFRYSSFISYVYLNALSSINKYINKSKFMILNNREIDDCIESLESTFLIISNMINDTYDLVDDSISEAFESILFGVLVHSLSYKITYNLINTKYIKLKGFTELRLNKYFYGLNDKILNVSLINNYFIKSNPLYHDILINLRDSSIDSFIENTNTIVSYTSFEYINSNSLDIITKLWIFFNRLLTSDPTKQTEIRTISNDEIDLYSTYDLKSLSERNIYDVSIQIDEKANQENIIENNSLQSVNMESNKIMMKRNISLESFNSKPKKEISKSVIRPRKQ